MSTEYFALREPFTAIRVRPGPVTEVGIEVGGASAGTVYLPKRWSCQINEMFCEHSPAAHSWFGGEHVGMQVALCGTWALVSERHIRPEAILVSEYGDVTTIGELLALRGQGKKQCAAEGGGRG